MNGTDADKVVSIEGENGNGNGQGVQLASLSLMRPDFDAITARSREFPATAELTEMLRPYYEHAANSLTHAGASAAQGKHAASFSSERLPESLAKEVRVHLGELQPSAFTLEAHGATQRADEVRQVAGNLHSMLKVAQQFWHSEKAAAPARDSHKR